MDKNQVDDKIVCGLGEGFISFNFKFYPLILLPLCLVVCSFTAELINVG